MTIRQRLDRATKNAFWGAHRSGYPITWKQAREAARTFRMLCGGGW